MDYDYHTHSTYSDGRFLSSMVQAASKAGLNGIGLADHCNVSNREQMQATKQNLGFNLDLTYERRREAIETLREHVDIAIYDAVEMDYDPRDEDVIDTFLDEAMFDYAIGSVHTLDEVNVHVESYFAQKSNEERHELVDRYFNKLVSLAESGLFDIAAHPVSSSVIRHYEGSPMKDTIGRQQRRSLSHEPYRKSMPDVCLLSMGSSTRHRNFSRYSPRLM